MPAKQLHTMTPHSRIWPMVAAMALTTGPLVRAQDDNTDGQVFDLPVFEVSVSNDRGYLATNSTSATSLNTEVRDLPVGIEIVTTEFIEDVQATDMKEALSYSPGVYFGTSQNYTNANTARSNDVSPSSGVQANDFNDAIIIRGYTVPNQQRLGFRVGTIVPGYGVTLGGITDSANIMRQEVVRGPQSLLYGINVLSGIVNFMPRKPLAEPRTEVSLSVGDDGFFRAVLDNTGPVIKDKLNYRLMGTYLQQDYEINLKSKFHEYYVGQVEWFINKDLKLFVEGQYADTRIEGIGQQYFVDGGSLHNGEYANQFDERYTFGRDFFNTDVFDQSLKINKSANQFLGQPSSATLYTQAGDTYLVENPRPGMDYTGAFADLGPYYNISGPDTYRERQEFDFTLLLNYSPLDNLDVEAGIFYTEVEDTEFNVRLGSFNNTLNTINPYSSKGDAAYNPEFDMGDPSGRGIGELFLTPDPRNDHINEAIDDTKYAYYMWYEKPISSESFQARLRAAYTIETDWFNRIPATHTFTGGFQFTEDKVSFVNTNWDVRPFYSTNQKDPPNNRLASDPVIFRKSVFDYEPIRYDPAQGELAYLGYLRILFGTSDEQYARRSGWYDVSLWYRGKYAVYHGKFFKDRLTLIAGVREDSYQVKEQELIRILDPYRETDVWQGYGDGATTLSQTPYFAGYGDKPFEPIPELSASHNAAVADYIEQFRQENPSGTTDYLFDDYTDYVTKTFGVSYRLTNDLSVYYLYSEGVFPNTGLRDGAYQPFDAETTVNNELGLKFEFLDRKISGRVSVWQIERENAVWSWAQAPAPARWWGGPQNSNSDIAYTSFAPERVDSYLQNPANLDARDIRYGVAFEYVELAYEQMGKEIIYAQTDRGPKLDRTQFAQYGATGITNVTLRDPEYEQNLTNAVMVNYHAMMAADEETGGQNPLRLAMDLAVRNSENLQMGGYPIYYYGYAATSHDWSHTASAAIGANVGYEEKGVGVDGQLILSPTENWQVILGYSYQNREVTSFNLVSGHAVDLAGNRSEETYTTEYDVWVMLLGPDNFEDPADPSSLKSGSIKGVDLSFVPKTNFNLWTKYTFNEGPLDGLEVGGGLNYYGPTPTSISIGGDNMQENPYSTPDIPDYFMMDLYLGYRINLFGTDWRVALNVYNVANTVKAEEIVTYETGEKVRYRRTRQYYDDRSFRLSFSARF